MVVFTRPYYVVVLLMVLALGVSLGLPMSDVLETVCDESETLPMEQAPLGASLLGKPSSTPARPMLVSGHRVQLSSPLGTASSRAQEVSPRPIHDSLIVIDCALRL